VKLPDILESGHVMQGLIGYQSPSLGRPVVHDRDARLECRDCFPDSSVQSAVVSNEVHIHRPDQTFGTGQIEEWCSGEITDIKKSKLAVAVHDSCRAGVFKGVSRGGAAHRTSGIG